MGTIDLNLLAIFVTVAQTGGFSAAARHLNIPKSSVSRSISTLEKTVGVQLVHRSTRHVALSTAGSALLGRIAPLLSSLRDVVDSLPELHDQPSGLLRITAPVDFGAAVLPHVVANFSATYPAVQVDLHLTARLVDLVAEGFDIAVRISARRLKDSCLAARSAGRIPMAIYASPAYLAARPIPKSPRDLDAHQWIMFRDGTPLRLDGQTGFAGPVEQEVRRSLRVPPCVWMGKPGSRRFHPTEASGATT
jgi:DNA-binding transcriptional LysR family regulator